MSNSDNSQADSAPAWKDLRSCILCKPCYFFLYCTVVFLLVMFLGGIVCRLAGQEIKSTPQPIKGGATITQTKAPNQIEVSGKFNGSFKSQSHARLWLIALLVVVMVVLVLSVPVVAASQQKRFMTFYHDEKELQNNHSENKLIILKDTIEALASNQSKDIKGVEDNIKNLIKTINDHTKK